MTYLMSDSPRATLQHEVEEMILTRHARGAQYAGFNLLLLSPVLPHRAGGASGDRVERTLTFDGMLLTNSGGGGAITARTLSEEEKRCGGMSNGIDRRGADQWPKVKHGTHAMNDLLQRIVSEDSEDDMNSDISESELTERLFELLTWVSPSPSPFLSLFRFFFFFFPFLWVGTLHCIRMFDTMVY